MNKKSIKLAVLQHFTEFRIRRLGKQYLSSRKGMDCGNSLAEHIRPELHVFRKKWEKQCRRYGAIKKLRKRYD